MNPAKYYIGIMSGTSADGVDLALVDFSNHEVSLIDHHYQAYHDELAHDITSLYSTGDNEIERMGALSVELALFFSQAVNQLLTNNHLTSSDIIAIGNHGQTIRHRPPQADKQYPFTLQIACHQTLACLTGIRTIGDFRTKDIALGGQGAPLVPAFHRYLFAKQQQDVFIANLGGIANITFLPQDRDQAVIGFDTGPANALLDLWCLKHTGNRVDNNGDWAAQGQVSNALLDDLLSDPYFALAPPKSTGREYFTYQWLEQYLSHYDISAVDVQATLSALTAQSLSMAIKQLSPKSFVYLCGGGIHNKHCYKQIKQYLSEHSVQTINTLNLNNNAFEAMAFAWLAFAYDKKIYGNIPTVTGAQCETILGVAFNP
ncbi:anhydro-N-acetylmuramic acid kinase [Thalassotalea sp. G2M2-11]|uniref:anhydro-N-acetylmuramic acid kinase n=1 Tax=Thalassotalea sp. G2M2-11 TaxID=2787627 RepID=UPI0019D055D0|nr:anhydro-N-acetylmuramic acid kinase [Thalassotalea sp. G2M2-11]